jgi:hypothetical protein
MHGQDITIGATRQKKKMSKVRERKSDRSAYLALTKVATTIRDLLIQAIDNT